MLTLPYHLPYEPTPLGQMSFSLHGAQYDGAFAPKRLGNWEVPASREREPQPRPPGYRTTAIVSENGHLLPNVPKRMTSFQTGFEGTEPKRWPVSAVPPFSGVAVRQLRVERARRCDTPDSVRVHCHECAQTMGYKGIQTDYLPTGTVYLRNNPDSDEFNYKVR